MPKLDRYQRRTVLNLAADIIMRPGVWMKGQMYRRRAKGEEPQYCAVGAVGAAVREVGLGRDWRTALTETEAHELIGFNDVSAGTPAQVAERLRELARGPV